MLKFDDDERQPHATVATSCVVLEGETWSTRGCRTIWRWSFVMQDWVLCGK